MDTAETLQIDQTFCRPPRLSDFFKVVLDIVEAATKSSTRQLLAHNTAHLFPNGVGSQRLLHTMPPMLAEFLRASNSRPGAQEEITYTEMSTKADAAAPQAGRDYYERLPPCRSGRASY
jgi:hypothetical protein